MANRSGKFKNFLGQKQVTENGETPMEGYPNDQKGISCRRVEREKAYRQYQKGSVVQYAVSNRISLSFNSLRELWSIENKAYPRVHSTEERRGPVMGKRKTCQRMGMLAAESQEALSLREWDPPSPLAV